MVQLAWALFDETEQELMNKVTLIKPDGFEIPEGATAIHGITTEKAMNEGIQLAVALGEFQKALDQAEILVAHNISFDSVVMLKELQREKKVVDKLRAVKRICTMKGSTEFCKIPGPYGYKWPQLCELHTVLFNSSFEGAHDAMNDVRACAKCFFELRRKGVLKL